MKNWQTFVLFGGVIGLSLVLALDVLTYISMSQYSNSPSALISVLERYAMLSLILKYWFVAVGFVALFGWSKELEGP